MMVVMINMNYRPTVVPSEACYNYEIRVIKVLHQLGYSLVFMLFYSRLYIWMIKWHHFEAKFLSIMYQFHGMPLY